MCALNFFSFNFLFKFYSSWNLIYVWNYYMQDYVLFLLNFDGHSVSVINYIFQPKCHFKWSLVMLPSYDCWYYCWGDLNGVYLDTQKFCCVIHTLGVFSVYYFFHYLTWYTWYMIYKIRGVMVEKFFSLVANEKNICISSTRGLDHLMHISLLYLDSICVFFELCRF